MHISIALSVHNVFYPILVLMILRAWTTVFILLIEHQYVSMCNFVLLFEEK